MRNYKGLVLRLRGIWRDTRYKGIRDVFWFILITLIIHYSYRFWAHELYYWPVQHWMDGFQNYMVDLVFNQSIWVDKHILGLQVGIEGHTLIFTNGEGISINAGCSGDKQILQLALLLLIFPGKWGYKLLFIPLGMILVHATNILRIVLLSLVAIWKPEWMESAHDTLLRGMFYVVIFLIWVWFIRITRK